MTTERGLQGALHSWLHEDRHEDATRVLHTVLDGVPTHPQHRPRWSVGGIFTLNKFVAVGLAAAAVVVIAVIAINLLPGSTPPGGPPSATPEASVAEPSPSEAAGLAVGSTVQLYRDTGVVIQATIPAPGWEPNEAGPTKNGGAGGDDGAWVFGTWSGPHVVPSDPCQWASTLPDAPATTLDEFVAALGSQATRDASDSADVTVDGHSGRMITLHVPADIAYSAADGFTDCDEGKFCTMAAPEGTCDMWYMGPDEFQEIWIVDVDGELLYETGNYYPGTPPDVVEELGAILASMTFE